MYKTDFISFEPEDEYHSRSKSGEFMSSHLLADFRKSPLLYRRKTLGQIEEPANAAFALGTAVHKMVLEGADEFNAMYSVTDGPVNEKTGEAFGKTTKAYQAWLAQQTKVIISTADFGTVARCRQSVDDHPLAKSLLSNGVPEGVVRADYCGVPCQIRMDYFHPVHGLVDYKTTAELQWFESDARRYGYILQMAFYHEVIFSVTGYDVPVHIVATEKCEPMATGVWLIPPETLQAASAVIRADLERFAFSKGTETWTTGYETERVLDNF